jgi:hypothetical protein
MGDDARGARMTQIWEIRTAGGGANGLEFARARIDPATEVLVHALPESVNVEAGDARGENLARTAESPMARLWIEGGAIKREDIWPLDEHLGMTVILCGGEAATLRAWWNAPDQSEWRWSIELYNHR